MPVSQTSRFNIRRAKVKKHIVAGTTIITSRSPASVHYVAIDRVTCEVNIFILKFPFVTSEIFLINIYKKSLISKRQIYLLKTILKCPISNEFCWKICLPYIK